MKNEQEAFKSWQKLGDIPVDDNEEIEISFRHFPIGTDKFEIWQWCEDEFDCSVAIDLLKTP